MGAIYGILGPADPAELIRMGARLAHRGRLEAHCSPTLEVRLGQRLRPEHGPSRAPEAGGAVVFDGFLDDAASLAARLGMDPERVRADPARAVQEICRREGPAGLAFLNGPFALALWDEARGRLLLARDRFGTRPLYFARVGERWAFASEYKALLALDDLEARPDRDAIQQLHCTKRRSLDSLLEGVEGVPCGGGVSLGMGAGAERWRYFEPRVRVDAIPAREQARRLREAVLCATRRQAAPYGTLGLLLSAGLDSAITLAALRHVAPGKPLHTFTGGHGPDDGDLRRAAQTARAFGTEHHEVVLRPEQLPELLPRVVWHIEDPVGREDNPYLYVTAREAAKRVPVLFGGHEADRLFAGMPRHKLVNAAYRLPLLRAPLRDLLRYSQTGGAPDSLAGRLLVGAYYRGTHIAPPQVLGAERFPGVDSLERHGPHPLGDHLAQGLRTHPGKQHVETLHSAFGLRMNAPFLDPDVIDVSLRMPDALRIRWLTREKHVLRIALRDLLPPGLAPPRKTLQRLRHDPAFADVLDGLAEQLLRPADVRDRGLFETEYVERVRRRPAGRAYPTERAYRLWSLIVTEIWARLFLDARGRAPEEIDPYGRPSPP
jgi:asparagine synthase (glutamine-hydrolysing)